MIFDAFGEIDIVAPDKSQSFHRSPNNQSPTLTNTTSTNEHNPTTMNTIKVLSVLLIATVATATSYVAPEPQCWKETRKCRWLPKHEGYKCKDYYADKYARCHPVMKYKQECDKPTYMPKHRPTKPEDTVNWEVTNSTVVSYNKYYATPEHGDSDYYYTKSLPKHPKNYPAVKTSSSPKYTAPSKYTTAPEYTSAPRATKPTANPSPVYANPPKPQTSSSTPKTKYAAPTPTPAYTAPAYKQPAATQAPMTSAGGPSY